MYSWLSPGSVQLQDYCIRPVWVPGTVSLMDFTAKGDAPVPSYAQGLFVPGEIWHLAKGWLTPTRLKAQMLQNQKMGTATLMGRSYRGRRNRLPLLPWLKCRIPQYRSVFQRAKLMPPRSRRNGTSVAGMAVLFFYSLLSEPLHITGYIRKKDHRNPVGSLWPFRPVLQELVGFYSY